MLPYGNIQFARAPRRPNVPARDVVKPWGQPQERGGPPDYRHTKHDLDAYAIPRLGTLQVAKFSHDIM